MLNKINTYTLFHSLLHSKLLSFQRYRDYIRLHLVKFTYFSLLCLLINCTINTVSAKAINKISAQPSDSIAVRKFKKENLEKYLSDAEYRYDREFRPAAPNLWERFKQWLFDKLILALGNENTSTLLRWTIYIICGAVIVYVILKLTNTSIRGLIYGEPQRGRIAFTESEENIHELDFEALIKEAVDTRQYNRAIRLYYLRTLKNLTDKKLIDWRINKTNHDYIQELSKTEFAPSFRSLTILFEYMCYGDFSMNQSDFEEASTQFITFDKQLQGTTAAINTSAIANT